jgi:hypothetical protein
LCLLKQEFMHANRYLSGAPAVRLRR